jgi:hypothetical protein
MNRVLRLLGANVAMNPELSRMAEHFFGYGRWEAPYWLASLPRYFSHGE